MCLSCTSEAKSRRQREHSKSFLLRSKIKTNHLVTGFDTPAKSSIAGSQQETDCRNRLGVSIATTAVIVEWLTNSQHWLQPSPNIRKHEMQAQWLLAVDQPHSAEVEEAFCANSKDHVNCGNLAHGCLKTLHINREQSIGRLNSRIPTRNRLPQDWSLW